MYTQIKVLSKLYLIRKWILSNSSFFTRYEKNLEDEEISFPFQAVEEVRMFENIRVRMFKICHGGFLFERDFGKFRQVQVEFVFRTF